MEHHYKKHIWESFFVKYPDGNRSIKMFYKNAKTYSELFKGEIWHIPSNKVIQ